MNPVTIMALTDDEQDIVFNDFELSGMFPHQHCLTTKDYTKSGRYPQFDNDLMTDASVLNIC